MDLMTPTNDAAITQLLVNLGFILTASAYLLRDILWLRLLAILANICGLLAAYWSPPDPHWSIVAWVSSFIAINLAHSAWLIYERHLMRLTDEEKRLCDAAFQALDIVSVRKLLRCGSWISFAERECLVRQDVDLDRLLLIASGEATVLVDGQNVAQMSSGKFVGELNFLNDTPATATVAARSPMRCIEWDKYDLRLQMERQPELLNVFYAAVGRDLASKLFERNVTISDRA